MLCCWCVLRFRCVVGSSQRVVVGVCVCVLGCVTIDDVRARSRTSAQILRGRRTKKGRQTTSSSRTLLSSFGCSPQHKLASSVPLLLEVEVGAPFLRSLARARKFCVGVVQKRAPSNTNYQQWSYAAVQCGFAILNANWAAVSHYCWKKKLNGAPFSTTARAGARKFCVQKGQTNTD